ncbi:MAG: DUF190 domain-containing protein [Candidatus Cyclobacteriaceae bacterium M3_2C_046]
MKISENAQLLRIFIGEADETGGKPLYESIVHKAHQLNIAGATVLRGILGYGARSHIHSSKFLRLSEDLPVVIEMVDAADKIKQILPYLDEVVIEGLVTLEEVKIFKYTT